MENTQIALANLELAALEAIVETMLLAAYADGSVNAAERAELGTHLATLTEGRLGPEIARSLVEHVERSVATEGRESRFASIRARLPDVRMREAAIELAIRLVTADGIIRDCEHALLVEAARALEVPLATRGRIEPLTRARPAGT